MKKVIKKAQSGKKISAQEKYTKTADSLMSEDQRKMKEAGRITVSKDPQWKKKSTDLMNSASNDFEAAQKFRKKAYELSKNKMKNGGSLTSLKASAKRVGPVDPKGAYTAVQKKALAGAKGKASLTKDKQLGATKMAKRGMSIKKK